MVGLSLMVAQALQRHFLHLCAGTGIGGVAGPWFFGALIDTGSRWSVFGGYLLGSMLMLAAALIAARFGVAISLPAIGFNVLALAIWRVSRAALRRPMSTLGQQWRSAFGTNC